MSDVASRKVVDQQRFSVFKTLVSRRPYCARTLVCRGFGDFGGVFLFVFFYTGITCGIRRM